jgi:hypothetical protein
VKAKNRHPMVFLRTIPVPKRKWEVVTIVFITKFPKSTRQHDSIMVALDKLTNHAHFFPVKTLIH